MDLVIFQAIQTKFFDVFLLIQELIDAFDSRAEIRDDSYVTLKEGKLESIVEGLERNEEGIDVL